MFHDNLVRLMKGKGMNQSQLCKKSGVKTSSMSHYVRGDTGPSFSQAIAIADALGVSVDELAYSEHDCSRVVLSHEERELVEMFRSLSDKGRHAVLAGLRDFSGR